MNDLEQRVREAFDEVSLPPEVRARTLAAIDDLVQPREASPSKLPAPRIVKWRRAAIALAACLALTAVGLIGSRLYFEETAFVGIDVNPSIELGINRFDIVVSAKAYNEDGEALLRDVSVTGKPYDSAVATLTSSPTRCARKATPACAACLARAPVIRLTRRRARPLRLPAWVQAAIRRHSACWSWTAA